MHACARLYFSFHFIVTEDSISRTCVCTSQGNQNSISTSVVLTFLYDYTCTVYNVSVPIFFYIRFENRRSTTCTWKLRKQGSNYHFISQSSCPYNVCPSKCISNKSEIPPSSFLLYSKYKRGDFQIILY